MKCSLLTFTLPLVLTGVVLVGTDLSLEILMNKNTVGWCQSKSSFQKCSISNGWGVAITGVRHSTEPKLIPWHIVSSVLPWWDLVRGRERRKRGKVVLLGPARWVKKATVLAGSGQDAEEERGWQWRLTEEQLGAATLKDWCTKFHDGFCTWWVPDTWWVS